MARSTREQCDPTNNDGNSTNSNISHPKSSPHHSATTNANLSCYQIWSSPYGRRLLLLFLSDLVIAGIMATAAFLVEMLPPVQRPIDRNDPSIAFPHANWELVPFWALPIVSTLIPSLIILCVWAIQKFRNTRVWVAFFGLALALSFTFLLTSILKELVGRPRPDFLSRCNPDPNILDKLICRGSKKFTDEGRRSFPSGHASLSFTGFGFVTFVLSAQLGLLNGHGSAIKFIICTCPFILASLVALSRFIDNRHHWQDILVGSGMGSLVAYLVYRLYFPPISAPNSHIPYSSRFDTALAKYGGSLGGERRRENNWQPFVDDKRAEEGINSNSPPASPLKQYQADPSSGNMI